MTVEGWPLGNVLESRAFEMALHPSVGPASGAATASTWLTVVISTSLSYPKKLFVGGSRPMQVLSPAASPQPMPLASSLAGSFQTR